MNIKSFYLLVILSFQFFNLVAQDLDYSINNRISLSINDSISIVGLGDPTHQESTITKYRIDLIKKLVRESGFKIIAIEGNFFELYEAHQDFLKTKDYDFYEKAMFSQLNATEMEELYDFVYEENKTGNPIYIIGFDVSFSGSTFSKRVEDKLKINPIFTDKERDHFVKLLKKVSNTSWSAIFRNDKKSIRDLKPYLEEIASRFSPKNESDFFFLQAIQNLSYYFYSLEDENRNNRRDYAMSHHLNFMKNYFKDEKIILFGSNTHLKKEFKGGVALGEELHKKYGEAYHFIAYTSLSGKKYNPFGKPKILPDVSENSIEAQIKKQHGNTPFYLTQQDVENIGIMECRMFGHSFMPFDLEKMLDSLVLISDVEPFKIKNNR